jgi:subtilisin family serine protease
MRCSTDLARLTGMLSALILLAAAPAFAQTRPSGPIPDGADLVRLLGSRATFAFASPKSPGIGGLVRLPHGQQASVLGLREVAPGIARLWDTPTGLIAFGQAHPELPIEVVPPMHLLLDVATSVVRVPRSARLEREVAASAAAPSALLDGTGAVVGIADTGVDVTHPDFLDATGATRVAWLLDLGAPPRGKWPALEQAYGLIDPTTGAVIGGAVWSADDINGALSTGNTASLPQDSVGHGTLVASCAAGNGSGGKSVYQGVAPGATIVVARIVDSSGNLLGNDDILRAVQFLFDQADSLHLPIVVNLSVGSDFGPHDGTMAWEEVLASHVGPSAPGHILIAAAGNSGSIAPQDSPVHENVYVSGGQTTRVPIVTSGAQNGGADVWVAMHAGAVMSVGLDSPDGTWISPVEPGQSAGAMTSDSQAAVVNGSEPAGSPVPAQSHGAVVIWTGKWQAGTYFVTLTGTGNADLYVQGEGDAEVPGGAAFGFAHGVREGTVTLPATHPAIISVGCTISKIGWRSINQSPFGLSVPLLDAVGGMPDPAGGQRSPVDGEPCWFSSAGPTLTGVQKPELAAPGAVIVGALSGQAIPPVATSIFTTSCPDGSADLTCQQVDPLHAASAGTSFSAPLVAGAVAVLLQRNSALTQADALALLQGGAHHLRGPAPFDDQSGVAELDVLGALTLADAQASTPPPLPNRADSWLTLGAEFCVADGSTPLQAVIELRSTPAGSGPPLAAEGFDESRLSVYARVEGSGGAPAVSVSISRSSPGVRIATIFVPAGLGGTQLTVGATFDGVDVVQAKTLPIATDHWNADYLPVIAGGCAVSSVARTPVLPNDSPSGLMLWAAGTVFLGGLRSKRRERQRCAERSRFMTNDKARPSRLPPADRADRRSQGAAKIAPKRKYLSRFWALLRLTI